MPPITTTRKDGTSIAIPTSGVTPVIGPPKTPAMPAISAPSPKTIVKRFETSTPRKRSISGSRIPARTTRPKRVKRSKRKSARRWRRDAEDDEAPGG